MGKIGKALGFPMTDGADEGEDPSLDSEGVDEPTDTKPGKAEVIAMRQFMAADTAEAKASAMKDFLELCGSY